MRISLGLSDTTYLLKLGEVKTISHLLQHTSQQITKIKHHSLIKGTGSRKIISTGVNSHQAINNIFLNICKLIDDIRLCCYIPEYSPLQMLRQRDGTASENVALGDMTSKMAFIVPIHSLMGMSHFCKGRVTQPIKYIEHHLSI